MHTKYIYRAKSCTALGVLDTADVTAGASDDIRRATELAYRSVSEFGLSAAVGPLAVASMAGDDGSFTLRDSGSTLTAIVFRLSVACVDTAAVPSEETAGYII